MIKVTEIHNVDGVGEVWKDVEYPRADSFSQPITDGGTYIIKSVSDSTKEIEWFAYYLPGSFVKIVKS